MIALVQPVLTGGVAAAPSWQAGVQGALVALPLFLAFLHLALFGFDPRARANLFFALEMAAFVVITLRQYRNTLLPNEAQRELIDRLGLSAPVVAIVFGLLTYYAIRTDPFPRTWRAFVGAGLVLLPLTFLSDKVTEYGWIAYFFAVTLEILRLERSERIVRREGAGFFIVTFAFFSFAIVLQILVNYDLIPAVGGFSDYYLLGLFAVAVGMSLSLARDLGQSRLVEAENARKSRELAQARELQLSMLPHDLPAVSGLDVAAATHTAAEVGGDYYDARAGDDGNLLLAFGDATGHGLASGIVVTAAKALFTSLPAGGALPELLAHCDRVLRGMRFPGLQMCLALARISPREAAVASAAMPPILIHRSSSGAIEELGVGGLPLGGRIPFRYEERRTALAAGDTLLFASDGFAELLDPEGRELGYPGAAKAFLAAARGESAHAVVDRLGASAAAFRGARPQDDDITFVVVRVTASGSAG